MKTHESAAAAARWHTIAQSVLAQGDNTQEHADLATACVDVVEAFAVAHALRCEVSALKIKVRSNRQAMVGAFVLAVVFGVGAALAARWGC